MQVTQKSFKFAEKHGCPFFFVSASDGTNVVRIFNEAILQGALLAAANQWGSICCMHVCPMQCINRRFNSCCGK
jgi:uncharacterized protein YtpQ (UPF0354 family)